MTLTLTIRNADSLENGAPTEFVLHRRGATIGRAPTCEWSLPDPHRYISSRHCEVAFRDGAYFLSDVSTNGTFLNGETERMAGERVIADGDLFQIGHYEVIAQLSGSALAATSPDLTADEQPEWAGWDSHAPGTPAAPPAADGWDEHPDSNVAAPRTTAGAGQPWSGGESSQAPIAASSAPRWGAPPQPPQAQAQPGWDPSHRAEMPAASVWSDAAPPSDPASAWSSAAPDRPPEPSPNDVWGRIAEGNVVDWARGGFGQPAPPARDSLGLSSSESAARLPEAAPARPRAAPQSVSPQPSAQPAVPGDAAARQRATPASNAASDRILRDFLMAAGVDPAEIRGAGPQTVIKAGGLLRSLVAGLVVLVEARARAKSQMGAESTRFEVDGNNPIKFARAPEQALARLLGPSERGFMEAGRAVEDAYFDLQSHQMATLRAMQGALKATLERFSPDAIRRRTEPLGLLARLLPSARDASLWRGYEREFSGVAQGSDEAFMDVFAKEFRKAYEEQSRQAR